MACEPYKHTALGELRRIQISEHVGRRKLSCEAERLRGEGTELLMGSIGGAEEVCETILADQRLTQGIARIGG